MVSQGRTRLRSELDKTKEHQVVNGLGPFE